MVSYDENASAARHKLLQDNSAVKGWMHSIRHLTLA
jgi:hypothetical protein